MLRRVKSLVEALAAFRVRFVFQMVYILWLPLDQDISCGDRPVPMVGVARLRYELFQKNECR